MTDELINPDELKVTVETPNPGGQQCGVYHGVTVTHLPTGIKVIVPCLRSQHRNRKIAIEMIECALTSPDFKG